MKSGHPTDTHNTSIAGWSFAIAAALKAYGVDASERFGEAGIDLDAIESPDARLPVSSVQQVWHWAAENTDELFGVEVSSHLTPMSFHVLGPALWSSSTMLEFLERLIRYRCVISHKFFCELLDEGDNYRISLVDQRNLKTEITHDAFMGYLVRMSRLLDQQECSPTLIRSSRAENYPTERLREFFGTAFETGSGESSIYFDRESLHRPLLYGNPELAQQLDNLVERYIGNLGLISEHLLIVRSEIHRLLSAGEVSIDQVADALNVTVRTLQRRLSAEQSTYNQLLDEVRHQLAMDFVKDPSINVSDMSFKLGFNDSGSFGRSFKRWTGKSFTEYRDTMM